MFLVAFQDFPHLGWKKRKSTVTRRQMLKDLTCILFWLRSSLHQKNYRHVQLQIHLCVCGGNICWRYGIRRAWHDAVGYNTKKDINTWLRIACHMLHHPSGTGGFWISASKSTMQLRKCCVPFYYPILSHPMISEALSVAQVDRIWASWAWTGPGTPSQNVSSA